MKMSQQKNLELFTSLLSLDAAAYAAINEAAITAMRVTAAEGTMQRERAASDTAALEVAHVEKDVRLATAAQEEALAFFEAKKKAEELATRETKEAAELLASRVKIQKKFVDKLPLVRHGPRPPGGLFLRCVRIARG